LMFSLCGRGREYPRRKNGTAKRTKQRRTTRWCGLDTLISYLPWVGWTMRWSNTRRPRSWLLMTTRSWSKRLRRYARPAGRLTRRSTTGGPCDFTLRWVHMQQIRLNLSFYYIFENIFKWIILFYYTITV